MQLIAFSGLLYTSGIISEKIIHSCVDVLIKVRQLLQHRVKERTMTPLAQAVLLWVLPDAMILSCEAHGQGAATCSTSPYLRCWGLCIDAHVCGRLCLWPDLDSAASHLSALMFLCRGLTFFAPLLKHLTT